MYIDGKYVGELKYKIGQIVYSIYPSDSESRWIVRLKIIAVFPGYSDLISLQDGKELRDLNLYETIFVDAAELEKKRGDAIDTTDTFRREIDLFGNIEEAASEVYRQIKKEWEDEQ